MGNNGGFVLHTVTLLWCIFLGMAIICHARNSDLISGSYERRADSLGMSLKGLSMDDYSDPSANHRHDPKPKMGTSNRNLGSDQHIP